MDWGYNHPFAVYWAGHNLQDGRVYVYREFCGRRMTATTVGAEIARISQTDLAGLESGTMSLFLSPDAFAKRGDESGSLAEQLASGISSVIGPRGVYLADPGEELHTLEGESWRETLDRRQLRIVLKRAQNARIAGWEHCREALRWSPLTIELEQFNREYALSLIEKPDGTRLFREYVKRFERQQAGEVLPKWRIVGEKCPRLVAGIQRAFYADNAEDVKKEDADPETGLGGDDEIDAWRYLVMGFVERKVEPPPRTWFLRRLEEVQAKNPGARAGNGLFQAAMFVQDEYNRRRTGTIPLTRQSMRHRGRTIGT